MDKKYTAVFLKEVTLLFEKYPQEISLESREYLNWVRGYLNPRHSEYQIKK